MCGVSFGGESGCGVISEGSVLFGVAFTFPSNVTLKAHYRQCFTTRIKEEKNV